MDGGRGARILCDVYLLLDKDLTVASFSFSYMVAAIVTTWEL